MLIHMQGTSVLAQLLVWGGSRMRFCVLVMNLIY